MDRVSDELDDERPAGTVGDFLSNMESGMDSQVSIFDDWYCQDVRIDVSNIERFHVKTDSS